ncbi:reverse transcriptase domain-containing protein [Tanacetum coccineum]
MMNAKGFFFVKFDTRAGLEAVLEEGPRMIRNSPIILKKWSMKTSLQKEELTRIPIWVKLHDVPIQVFEEDGFIKETIRVKYEWKPPRCHTCHIFGHTVESCPKKVVVTPVANDTNDGFQKVVNKKRDNKGLLVKLTLRQIKLANIATPNPFADLGVEDDEEEDVENIYDESENLNIKNTRASTPAQIVSDVYRWKWTSNGSLSPKDNYYIDRRELWNNLVGHAGLMRNRPWVLLGDFNASLNIKDHSAGGYEPDAAMREFKECVQAIEVSDLNCTGLHFTWNQKPKGSNGILKKIDRIMEASLNEERFLRQNFKIEWLKAGDSNTAYFRKIVKSKCDRNRIEMVRDASNIIYEGNVVVGAFVSHYENFLGIEGSSTPHTNQNLFSHVLESQKSEFMVREDTDNEIKEAIFSMGDDKAPGPNGFTSAFVKEAWDVVGTDVTNAIHDFFMNGRLLKDINHTIISLVPKVSTPSRINDYRPISCCNQKVSESEVFYYHHLCDKQKIINLCFADELFLFARGHPSSIGVIMQGLKEFKNVSGLVSSIPKSTTFFCNVPNALKTTILNSMPFTEGSLSVRYLGVPLISSRLLYRDCKILVEKLKSRIND